MTHDFSKLFVSIDAFGDPVSLNYRGETSYKTAIGALFTLAIKSFMLVYTV